MQQSPPRLNRLALTALIIAVATVLARATLLESIRDPFEVSPGSQPYARGAGAAAGVVLDLLCCIPALLILLSQSLRATPVRSSTACRLAGLLALWTAASVLWADDQFAAALGAAHVIAAMTLLWAAVQLIDTWPRLRLITALAHGLLMVYLTQAILYKFVELPATAHSFALNKDEFLRERGWKPGSFLDRQFEKKVASGEMVFFHGSANSFAATLVLLLGITAGLVIQRTSCRDFPGAALVAVVIPIALWIVALTQCKAALATPVLIASILLIVWKWKSKLNYWLGLALVALSAIALLSLGLIRHGLPTASLNFRWRYWTAAWKMFLARPLLGVGWANFGLHYLRYRLAQAAEEIQEPHNYLIRWLTELGLIGATLGIAWLARLWWELTRPGQPGKSTDETRGIGLITFIAVAAMVINSLAGLDYARSGSYVIIEIMKRALFVCVLVVGSCCAGLRSMKQSQLDDRPAPWVLYALLASLAAFLIHNLIEFSLFETGPMMVFALLAGSAIGVRRNSATPTHPKPVLSLAVATTVWLAAAFALAIPVVQAESLAADGDDLLRANQFDQASANFLSAFHDHVDFNSDYLYRAAMALAYKPGADRATIKNLFDQAIAVDPSVVVYHLSRGRVELEMHDAAASTADFARALELNPNEVSIRLEYADILMRTGSPPAAMQQYEQTLHYNDLLPLEEPKRINDGEIRAHYAAALLAAARPADASAQARQALHDNNAFGADDPRRLDAEKIKQLEKTANK